MVAAIKSEYLAALRWNSHIHHWTYKIAEAA
jgi:hypothetical protein